MKKKSASKKGKQISVDTKAGSLAYNRLDMQVSQTLHMAIELYPNLNYLFVLDYYDDITLFDDDVSPSVVSYYQVKTSEDSISIDTAISESWIAKLYEHLTNPEWIVSELGLITSCPLKMTIQFIDGDGKRHRSEKSYVSEKTDFVHFDTDIINKVKTDIATRKGIPVDDVDLSKFVHMRTTLSIPKHREIVEQEMSSFLQKQFPRITVDSAKTIYNAMMDLLTRRQSYELLDEGDAFKVVREKKGVSKNDFSRIIDEAMLIAIPPFQEIGNLIGCTEDDKYRASYEYTRILTDFQSKSESFTAVFMQIRNICIANPQNNGEESREYCNRIYTLIPSENPIYNKTYICILVACILINKWRRMQ